MAETIGRVPKMDVGGMLGRASEILSGIDPESDLGRASGSLAYAMTLLTLAASELPAPTQEDMADSMSRVEREFGDLAPWVQSGDSSYSRVVSFGEGSEALLRVSGGGTLWTWAVDYDDASIRCGIRNDPDQAMDAADGVARSLISGFRSGRPS